MLYNWYVGKLLKCRFGYVHATKDCRSPWFGWSRCHIFGKYYRLADDRAFSHSPLSHHCYFLDNWSVGQLLKSAFCCKKAPNSILLLWFSWFRRDVFGKYSCLVDGSGLKHHSFTHHCYMLYNWYVGKLLKGRFGYVHATKDCRSPWFGWLRCHIFGKYYRLADDRAFSHSPLSHHCYFLDNWSIVITIFRYKKTFAIHFNGVIIDFVSDFTNSRFSQYQ